MFTPKGFEVSLRVSRIAVRRASGEGCESAVRMPVYPGMRVLVRATASEQEVDLHT